MPSWSQVTKPYGEYTSEVFNISNNLSRYIIKVETTEINIHNEKLEYYFSISYDNINWTSWERFYEQSSDFLNPYNLSNIYFKYKVVMGSSSTSTKPFLQSISLTLEPYFLVSNGGDLTIKPKMWFTKTISAGTIQLFNHYTGQKIEFKDLQIGEEVYVDFDEEDIISSLQSLGVYRYDNHNNEWLYLPYGENYLRGYGNFNMDIRYQFKLLQE